jgi:tetratricopeptide (TPR) repeat protein
MARLEVQEAQNRQAVSFFLKDPYGQAVLISKKVMKKPDLQPMVQESLLFLGKTLREAMRYPEAIEVFQTFLERFPSGPFEGRAKQEIRDTLWRYLDRLFLMDDHSGVIDVFQKQKALLLQGSLPRESFFQVGESFFRLGFYQGVVSLYEAGKTQLGPKALLRLGEAYLNISDPEKGVQTLRSILLKFPRSPQRWAVLKSLGDHFFFSGSYSEAIEVYREWLNRFNKDPRSDQLRLRVARSFQRMEEYVSASQSYQDLIDYLSLKTDQGLTSMRSMAYVEKGDSLYEARRFKEALWAYQHGIKIQPESELEHWAKFQIGNCWVKLNQPQKAKTIFGEVSKISKEKFLRDITREKLVRLSSLTAEK